MLTLRRLKFLPVEFLRIAIEIGTHKELAAKKTLIAKCLKVSWRRRAAEYPARYNRYMMQAVLMLYGNYGLHPWQEDMFTRPDLLQAMLREAGLEFHVGCITQAPTGRDEIPEARIARNPIYNQEGVLEEAHFTPGSIEDYPVIIDHWVANFQDEITHNDGSVERVAYGIGLAPERLVNHKNVQDFGNRKDKIDRILKECKVAVDTWIVGQVDELVTRYGESSIIYKPLGGSGSKGIATFKSAADLKAAQQTGKLLPNGPHSTLF